MIIILFFRLRDVDEHVRAQPSVVSTASVPRSPKSAERPRVPGPDSQAGADKVSRDSGVISPSDNGLEEDTEDDLDPVHEEDSDAPQGTGFGAPLQVHDTPSLVHNNNNYLAPVKAEVVTNELDEEEERPGSRKQQTQQPPPYHIAATKSKQAGNFYNLHHQQQSPVTPARQQHQEEHFYENQESVKRAGLNGQSHGRPLERKASFLSDGTFESISEVFS